MSIPHEFQVVERAKLERVEGGSFRGVEFRYYEYFLAAFVVVLLISNLVGQKLVSLPLPVSLPLIGNVAFVSAAQLMFPLTYIFGDVFTEVYGYAGSRRAIWMGFLSNALMSLLLMLIVPLPPAPVWKNQAAFETVFTQVPLLVFASLVAFWAGEFANSFVMAKMKVLTNGRWLWMRTIGSTAVGQFVDTVVLMTIAFGATTPLPDLINVIVSGYIFKVLYEAVMTPVTYLVVNWLKRAEGVDVFDRSTDFTPFRL